MDDVIRFATLDSSPMSGTDWLLFGVVTLRRADLIRIFRLAQQLWRGELQGEADLNACRELEKLLKYELQMPGALGSGRTSLRHKVHCICHCMRQVVGSWAEVCSFISTIFAWTGDMGTESGISSYYDDIRLLFGDWIMQADQPVQEGPASSAQPPDEEPVARFDFQPEEGHMLFHDEWNSAPVGDEGAADVDQPVPAEEAAPVGDAACPYIIDCRGSLYIAGILHIIHNATSDFGLVLKCWKPFCEQLKQVCRLLSRKHTKQRFLHTCFAHEPYASRQSEVKGFNHNVHEKRWGTAMAAICDLIGLRVLLISAWSLDLFKKGGGLEQPGDSADTTSVNVQAANVAILDPFFGHIWLCLTRWLRFCCTFQCGLSPALATDPGHHCMVRRDMHERLPSRKGGTSLGALCGQ